MSDNNWTLEKDKNFEKNGDYVVRDSNGFAVIIETAYYPAAPDIEDAALIVDAVNFYRAHFLQTQDQSDKGGMR